MTTDHIPAPSDDDLVDLLRQTLDVLPAATDPDPPPSSVIEGARWVHEWLTMEAELAELTFDSDHRRELAGVRSTGSLRELTFVTGDHTIEVEIEAGPRTVKVSGTIEPPLDGSMQLVVGGEIFSSNIDRNGVFAVHGVAPGTVLAYIETRDDKIRLGAFEI